MVLHGEQSPGGGRVRAAGPLPPYTLRRSARVRYARLVVSPHEGLVVVVPPRFDAARVPDLVAARATWIEAAARRLGTSLAPPGPVVLPERVALVALGEHWELTEQPSGATRAHVEPDGARLVVHRPHGGLEEDALDALRAWLTRRARVALDPWLHELAAEQSLTVGRISIRAQRTRWGSCSARGDVSLNRALLFLPPELVGHVMHHELCHRVELNHSPRFWARLAAMDPESGGHAVALRGGWRHVPRWAT